MKWTNEKIQSLAPDAGTLERARKTARTRRWKLLEMKDDLLWGRCRSTGATLHKTAVNLQEEIFYCSCPSRPFPCKHVLSLLLLWYEGASFSPVETIPLWVVERLEKAARPTTKRDRAERDKQRSAQRSRARSKRLQRMASGMDELELWLEDCLRQGLAKAAERGPAFFEDIATRMVDAKLGGLARRFRRMGEELADEEWHQKILAGLSEAYLILRAFRKRQELPEPLLTEVLSQCGLNIKKEEVLQGESQEDIWLVTGQVEGVEEKLRYRRTW
ncbi:MAG: SWIM zinc finger family protein, partial [Saprospiraceae bacterium]|nr:SWIM zinc finger family protein [Saprospiraceae bacterium]